MSKTIFKINSFVVLLALVFSSMVMAKELVSSSLNLNNSLDSLRRTAFFKVSIAVIATEGVELVSLNELLVKDVVIDDSTTCSLIPKSNQNDVTLAKNSFYSSLSKRPRSAFGADYSAGLTFKATLNGSVNGDSLDLYCVNKSFDFPKFKHFKDAFSKIGVDLNITYSVATK